MRESNACFARVVPNLTIALLTVALTATSAAAQDPDGWPPAPPLPSAIPAEDAAALPPSLSVEPLSRDEWRCTFHFRPDREVESVAVAGSFNGWDHQANPLTGPNANGEWTGHVDLRTGVHEYKFLINNEDWQADPLNLDRVPDGFGGYNCVLRLGRLARMRTSPAVTGDGHIEPLGLAHRPPEPLYIQPLGNGTVSIRYRTFAHDAENVSLAVRNGPTRRMQVASEGPLFTYYEARVDVPETNGRSAKVRSVQYTFVLEDGEERATDPHTYYYSFTPTSVFETPEWTRHAIWYQIMLDRFRNGDPTNDPDPVRPWTSAWFEPSPWEAASEETFYQYFAFNRFYGGDLAGLEAKLPYLKELGVNALYLNPVFESPSYHKYDVTNYCHIDDNFGTKGDYAEVVGSEALNNPDSWKWTPSDQQFLDFLKKAHDMGFKVILDGVFNHVGQQHPAFQDVMEHGQASNFNQWFEITSWDPLRWQGWADFEHMPVFQKNRRGFADEDVRKHIFAITRRWMDPNGDGDPSDGIDGWRLDVPNEVPRPFWVRWRRLVKEINPDALITGEIWHRADQWLDGQHFDAVMNYEFAKTAVAWIFNQNQKITSSEAAARLAELRLAYPSAATYALQNLVSSHDTDRLASMAQNPDRAYDRQNRVQDNNPDYNNNKPTDDAYARARLVTLLQMTYIGAPMIYYGDEVGMWGADDPTCRKPMLWKDLEPYANPDDNHVLDDHLAFYKQVIALRNAHPSLRVGDFETLLTDDKADVWAYLRQTAGESAIVVLNPSTSARTVQVPLRPGLPTTWQVALDGENTTLTADGNQLTVEVPPISGTVLFAQ